MPRNKLRKKIKEGRPKNPNFEYRTPRPKPKIDFGIEALDFKNGFLFGLAIDILYRKPGALLSLTLQYIYAVHHK